MDHGGPIFEYIGIRAIFQGMAQFRSDVNQYNAVVKSLIDATTAQAQTVAGAAQTTAKAWTDQAVAAKANAAEVVASYKSTAAAALEAVAVQQAALEKLQAVTVPRTPTGQFMSKSLFAEQIAAQERNLALAKQTAQATIQAAAADAQAAVAAANRAGALATLGQAMVGVSELGSKALTGLNYVAKQTVDVLETVGASALKLGGVGLVGLTAATVLSAKEFAGFQQTLAYSSAATQSSQASVAQLGDTINRLASTSGAARSDIQDMSAELSRVGVSAAQQNQGLLQATVNLQLASAGALSFQDAAKQVITAIREFNLSTSDAAGVTDVITTALHNTTLTAQDFFTAFKLAGPIMRDSGVSFKDTATIISVLGNQLASGALVGAGLGQMFQRLIAPTDAAKLELKKYQIGLYDVNHATRPVLDVLNDLVSKFGAAGQAAAHMSDQERDSALATIFNTRSLKDVLAVINTSPEAWNKAIAAQRNATGAAQQAATIMGSTLGGEMNKLKGTVSTLAISFASSLAPALTQAGDSLRNFLASPEVTTRVQQFGSELVKLASEYIPKIGAAIKSVVTDIKDFNDRFNLVRTVAIGVGVSLLALLAPVILMGVKIAAVTIVLQGLSSAFQTHSQLVFIAAGAVSMFIAALGVAKIASFVTAVKAMAPAFIAIAPTAAGAALAVLAVAGGLYVVSVAIRQIIADGQALINFFRGAPADMKVNTDIMKEDWKNLSSSITGWIQGLEGQLNGLTNIFGVDVSKMVADAQVAEQAFADLQAAEARTTGMGGGLPGPGSAQAIAIRNTNDAYAQQEAIIKNIGSDLGGGDGGLGGGGTVAGGQDAVAKAAKSTADKTKEWYDALRSAKDEVQSVYDTYLIDSQKINDNLRTEIADRNQALAETLAQSAAEAQLAAKDAKVAEEQRVADQARTRALDEQIALETALFNKKQAILQIDLKNTQDVAKENLDYQTKTNDLQAKEAAKLTQLKTAQQKKAATEAFTLQQLSLDQQHTLNLQNLNTNYQDALAQNALQQQMADAQAAFQAQEDAKRIALQDQMAQEALQRQLDRINQEQVLRDKQSQENADFATKKDQERAAAEMRILDTELQNRLTKIKTNLDQTLAKLKESDAEIAAEDSRLTGLLVQNANLVAAAANQAAKALAALFKTTPPPDLPAIKVPSFPATAQSFQWGGEVTGRPGSAVQALLHPGDQVFAPTGLHGGYGGGGTSNTFNNYNYTANASYQQPQSVGSIRLDLAALVAASRR